ncbi:MAG: protease complex subunit PrcB family protein [Pseudomonadota bacterium]
MFRPVLIVVIATFVSACAAPAEDVVVDVHEVLSYQNCQGVKTGVTTITLADLAQIRGSRLLQSPNQQSKDVTTPDLVSQNKTSTMYVAFGGKKPTAGHSLFLSSIQQRANTLLVYLQTSTPDPKDLVAQVITTPCVVVEIDGLPTDYELAFFIDGATLNLNR